MPRPRISLLTALLLMTIVGMTVVFVQLWRSIEPLRDQNKQLRADNKRFNEERGTLVIDNRNNLHAIKIPSRFAGEDRKSFRVYIPPGQRYFAFVQVNNVPKAGLPEPKKLPDPSGILGGFQERLFARLDPGEHVVTLRTLHRGRAADISLVVAFASPRITLDAAANTSEDRWPTLKPERYSVFGDGVTSSTISVERGKPLVLTRYRIMGVAAETHILSYSIPEPDSPLDGVMLWLEPVTKQEPD